MELHLDAVINDLVEGSQKGWMPNISTLFKNHPTPMLMRDETTLHKMNIAAMKLFGVTESDLPIAAGSFKPTGQDDKRKRRRKRLETQGYALPEVMDFKRLDGSAFKALASVSQEVRDDGLKWLVILFPV